MNDGIVDCGGSRSTRRSFDGDTSIYEQHRAYDELKLSHAEDWESPRMTFTVLNSRPGVGGVCPRERITWNGESSRVIHRSDL